VSGALSPGVKQLWSKAGHLSPSNNKANYGWICNPTPQLCLHGMHRDSFTLLCPILHIWSWLTPVPFTNSTQWALHGPYAMTFNVFWTEASHYHRQ
jgi:hypothetical protein